MRTTFLVACAVSAVIWQARPAGAHEAFAFHRMTSSGFDESSSAFKYSEVGSTYTGIQGRAVAIDHAGRLLIAGSLVDDGVSQIAVVRIRADGTVDPSFGTDGIAKVNYFGQFAYGRAMVVDSRDRITVAGYVNWFGQDAMALVRFDSDGTLDAHFGFGGIVVTPFGDREARANAIGYDTSGSGADSERLIVGGYVETSSGQRFALAAYHANGEHPGSLDTSFGVDGLVTTNFTASSSEYITSLVVTPLEGKIVAAGAAFTSTSGRVFALARYFFDGELDDSFHHDGKVYTDFSTSTFEVAQAMALDHDGAVVVAGHAIVGRTPQFALARYRATGELDTTFDTDGRVLTPFAGYSAYGTSIAIDTSNRILVGGWVYRDLLTHMAVARYRTNGLLDGDFCPLNGLRIVDFILASEAAAFGIAVQSDGRIILGGHTH